MTQDEIIRMAREAGWSKEYLEIGDERLERFAALVAEATLEKAAQVCEEPMYFHQSRAKTSSECAAAIRSMK